MTTTTYGGKKTDSAREKTLENPWVADRPSHVHKRGCQQEAAVLHSLVTFTYMAATNIIVEDN